MRRPSRLLQSIRARAVHETAAIAELDRLRHLRGDELALEVLPAFGPDGVPGGNSARPRDLCLWLMRSHWVAFDPSPLQLVANVLNALRQLEHAGLVLRTESDLPTRWTLTWLGEWALAEETAAHLLKLTAFGSKPVRPNARLTRRDAPTPQRRGQPVPNREFCRELQIAS